MKIHYQDEYGEDLYIAYNTVTVPRIAETVVITDEDYRVKEVRWMVEGDYVVVTVTQNLIRSRDPENDNSGRLAEMQRAIVAVNKRQDVSEKKNRMLTEQVVTVRKHINQRIQQERKES